MTFACDGQVGAHCSFPSEECPAGGVDLWRFLGAVQRLLIGTSPPPGTPPPGTPTSRVASPLTPPPNLTGSLTPLRNVSLFAEVSGGGAEELCEKVINGPIITQQSGMGGKWVAAPRSSAKK